MKKELEEIIKNLEHTTFKEGRALPFIYNPNIIKNLSDSNWTSFVIPGIKQRMDFIEDMFKSEDELLKPEGIRMADELMVITQSYEAMVDVYETNRDKINPKNFKVIKKMTFFMRSWITKFSAKIFTKGEVVMDPGSSLDSPKTIIKTMLGENN